MADLNNNDIFKYLKPTQNEYYSYFEGSDLNDFFNLLANYNLELRNTIGIQEDFSFGLEIEGEGITKDIFSSKLDYKWKKIFNSNCNGWKLKSDDSLNGINPNSHGIEINSHILYDNSKSWNTLNEICILMNKYAKVGPNCSGHIHVGAHIFDNNATGFKNFLKIWSIYECIIFRFTNGEFNRTRKDINDYAEPLGDYFKSSYNYFEDLTIDDILDILPGRKHEAISFRYVNDFHSKAQQNTIEFRCPNGTFSSVIWQNNINTLAKLIDYCCSNNFATDFINEKCNALSSKINFELYNNINIKEALEFADLIFKNNLDKIYFLRQYFKDFTTSDMAFTKVKKFYK